MQSLLGKIVTNNIELTQNELATHFYTSNSNYGVILGLDPGIKRVKRMQPAVFWIPASAGMTVFGEGNVIMRIAALILMILFP